MMQARATAKGIRIAPRKVRLVLDNVRNKDVSTALAILQNTPRNSSPVIYKLIQSAVANAMDRDSSADVDEMVIKEAYANEAYYGQAGGWHPQRLRRRLDAVVRLACLSGAQPLPLR
ncbi:MAG: uL22 family ribosomal protein, partial [SAR324 cluster bacterium]|nr:uL22 family ribosomal protein [SAR324 cluster bacterium]